MQSFWFSPFWAKEVLGTWVIWLSLPKYPARQAVLHHTRPEVRKGRPRKGRWLAHNDSRLLRSCTPPPFWFPAINPSSPSPNKGCIVKAGSPHPFIDCKALWLYLLSPTSAQKPPPCSISWFSKIHEESHVLSPCLKTHLAGTDKSPEIPVLKPELPPCSLVVMEMARLGARWPVSREHRNALSSTQGLLLSSGYWENNSANELKHKLGFIFRSCSSS